MKTHKKNVNDASGSYGPDTIISGIQWKDFYLKKWPTGGDWYVEDMPYDVEDESGKVIVDDDAMLKLGDLGYVYWQGKSDPPSGFQGSMRMDEFYDYVMKLNGTENVFVAFRVSPNHKDKLAEYAAGLGAELIS